MRRKLLPFVLVFGLFLAGCGLTPYSDTYTQETAPETACSGLTDLIWDGDPYVEVNGNVPYFMEEDFEAEEPALTFSPLDAYGRTGEAYGVLSESTMPGEDEERESLSDVTPSGWNQARYEDIESGGWLYNRCHLIAWALSWENDNPENLITGTRYLNIEGMLPFELDAIEYLEDNPDDLLLYRVTPVYEGDNLLADGVLLEAASVDDPEDFSFCVYLFNVQPGVLIDYETGESESLEF